MCIYSYTYVCTSHHYSIFDVDVEKYNQDF